MRYFLLMRLLDPHKINPDPVKCRCFLRDCVFHAKAQPYPCLHPSHACIEECKSESVTRNDYRISAKPIAFLFISSAVVSAFWVEL